MKGTLNASAYQHILDYSVLRFSLPARLCFSVDGPTLAHVVDFSLRLNTLQFVQC